jgi:hypothetical protein
MIPLKYINFILIVMVKIEVMNLAFAGLKLPHLLSSFLLYHREEIKHEGKNFLGKKIVYLLLGKTPFTTKIKLTFVFVYFKHTKDINGQMASS